MFVSTQISAVTCDVTNSAILYRTRRNEKKNKRKKKKQKSNNVKN